MKLTRESINELTEVLVQAFVEGSGIIPVLRDINLQVAPNDPSQSRLVITNLKQVEDNHLVMEKGSLDERS